MPIHYSSEQARVQGLLGSRYTSYVCLTKDRQFSWIVYGTHEDLVQLDKLVAEWARLKDVTPTK